LPLSLQAGNGTRLPVETKFCTANGAAKGCSAFAHDITGRKRLEAALRESWRKYQALLNALTARRQRTQSKTH